MLKHPATSLTFIRQVAQCRNLRPKSVILSRFVSTSPSTPGSSLSEKVHLGVSNVFREEEKEVVFGEQNIIDFEDTERIFGRMKVSEILTSYAMLQSCHFPLIRKFGPHIFEKGGTLVAHLAKNTYFRYFCGGETFFELSPIARKLSLENGLQCVFDYSVEGYPSADTENFNEEVANRKAQILEETIQFGAKQNDLHKNEKDTQKYPLASENRCSFAVLKVTGISNFALLEHLSQILCYISEKKLSPSEAKTLLPEYFFLEDYNPERIPAFKFGGSTSSAPNPLSQSEIQQLDNILNRLERLCQVCRNHGLPLLIDAEQSFVQPAIDQLYMILCLRHNKKDGIFSDRRPLIYNTYQMYLLDSYDRLLYDYEYAKQHQCNLAFKTVRGAYSKTEAERCSKLGTRYPIHKCIEDTHQNYDNGIRFSLDKIARDENLAILIATHNQNSVQNATNSMAQEFQIERKDQRVHFGQLYGMGDSLSLGTALKGFNVTKYVPFGPVQEVMHYLSRRLVENSDILGGSSIELKRYRREIARRLKSGIQGK